MTKKKVTRNQPKKLPKQELPFTAADLRALPKDKLKQVLSKLTTKQAKDLKTHWEFWARPQQLEPKGKDWDVWFINAGRGFGKLLCNKTSILTPNGFKPLGDIEVGDTIYDEAGEETKVLKTFDDTPSKAYRFTFSDGSIIDSCDEHQWVTWTHADRKAYNRSEGGKGLPDNWPTWRSKQTYRSTRIPQEDVDHYIKLTDTGMSSRKAAKVVGRSRISLAKAVSKLEPKSRETGIGPKMRMTGEIVETLTHGKRKDTNHSIPLTKPINMDTKEYLVDPYTFGYWLGDGYKFGSTFTCDPSDQGELISNLSHMGYEIGNTKCHKTVSCIGLITQLKRIGAYDKVIPEEYLYGDVDQRLWLLQGLMDSDGYAGGKSNTVEFCAKRKEHADLVMWLATSLGQKPKMSEGRAMLDGKDYGTKYRVFWRPVGGVNPFKLTRKASDIDFGLNQESRNYHRMIVSAEEITPKPMRCLTVDSPNSLFLVGRGLIPTHNTRAGVEWVRSQVKKGHRRIAAVASTNSDIERVMVMGESGFMACCYDTDKTERGVHLGYPVWSPTKRSLTWANGAKVEFYSAEEPERLRGPQFSMAWCFTKGHKVTMGDLTEVDVSDISVGDVVMTSEGPNLVSHTSQRDMPVGVVTLSDGTTLEGTYDHPVYTQKGYIPLGKLKGLDTCIMTGLSGTSTIKGTTTQKVSEPYTGTKLKSTTETLMDLTYTTSTVTSSTMIQQTCKSSQGQNTSDYTDCKTDQYLNERKPSKSVSAEFATKLSSVKESLKQGQFAKSVSIESQTKSVRKSKPVSSADQSSSVGLVPCVVNVVSTWQPTGVKKVYNLRVENTHEYFCNGVLTHNCDELAAWNKDIDTWDMLQFCLRLGKHPRICVTTTPKPTKLVRRILKGSKPTEEQPTPKVVVTSGSTFDNAANLADTYLETVKTQYEGTRLGRQELYAEVLEEAEGALWNTDTLDNSHITKEEVPDLVRIVVALDPAVTANKESDMTGIVVAGRCVNGKGYVLGDYTAKLSPYGWASKAIELYHQYEADCIVAEVNQGGDMVKDTIRHQSETVNYKAVRASRGKYARAEPISALYERGLVHHVTNPEDGANLNELETQMRTWEPLGSIGSPDRLDAMVWALTDLMMGGVTMSTLKLKYEPKGSEGGRANNRFI